MRVSQCFFCSGVAPTVIGSLPRNVASTAVATPRSMRAISSQTQIHIEGAAAEAAVLFGNEQQLNAQLVGAAHVAHDLERAFIACHPVAIRLLVRQALLGEIPERFQAQFQCLLVIMGDSSLVSATTRAFHGLLLVSSGRNSRMSVDNADIGHLENWELWGSC